MITEEQINYFKTIGNQGLPPGERIDVYIPIFISGQVIVDGGRRYHQNQHVRLDHIEVKDKSVLDIGCNTGYLSFRLKEKGAKYILALDYKQNLIDICNSIKEIDNVSDVDFICYNKYDFKIDPNNPVVTSEYYQFDVGLILSNFDFDGTVRELDTYGHYAKVWYLEPTNHPKHFRNLEDTKEYGLEVFKQFGNVEFLTYTDYQDRGLFKLTMNG